MVKHERYEYLDEIYAVYHLCKLCALTNLCGIIRSVYTVYVLQSTVYQNLNNEWLFNYIHLKVLWFLYSDFDRV